MSTARLQKIQNRDDLEEQLRRASYYARSLLEASLDPLVTISKDGKIMDVNRATELATGVPRDRLIGTDFSDYFTEPEKARAGYKEVFKQGEVRDYALAIRQVSGRIMDVLYNASIYKSEQGEVLGVFAAARDVTQQRRAEEEVRKRTGDLTKANEALREQQRAFAEASVPVIKVWDKILLTTLIGMFDSKRAQLATESLLRQIEESQAKVAILDISGIPVIDTLVAKHILRSISAAKLMGTECIITGVKPAISQTIVHLGVDLSGVITKSTLADGLAHALDLTRQKVVAK